MPFLFLSVIFAVICVLVYLVVDFLNVDNNPYDE